MPLSFTHAGAAPAAPNMQPGKTRETFISATCLFTSYRSYFLKSMFIIVIGMSPNSRPAQQPQLFQQPVQQPPKIQTCEFDTHKDGDNPQAPLQRDGFWTAVVGGCYRIIGAVSATANQVMMTPQLPTDGPGMMVCPRCQQTVLTRVKFKVGLLVWLFFFLLLL